MAHESPVSHILRESRPASQRLPFQKNSTLITYYITTSYMRHLISFRGAKSAHVNFRKFIEKPREFIEFYRIFRKFRREVLRVPERPTRRRGHRPPGPPEALRATPPPEARRTPGSPGGSRTIRARLQKPLTPNAGKCARPRNAVLHALPREPAAACGGAAMPLGTNKIVMMKNRPSVPYFPGSTLIEMVAAHRFPKERWRPSANCIVSL